MKFVVFLVLAACVALSANAQPSVKVQIKVSVVDNALNLKPVPKFVLVVSSIRAGSGEAIKTSTSASGVAEFAIAPGSYLVSSEKPLTFEGREYGWQVPLTVADGQPVVLELSSDNALVASAAAAKGRDVSRAGELFTSLRNGVVTVHGELGAGTGFIIDQAGLILTNQNVIDQSNEIRVRFDKDLAVRARLLASDEASDLAVLQVNLSAFPLARVLEMADPAAAQPAVVEGENVFSIGSPLHQEKILSSGIAGKITGNAIITDINFAAGNAGSPLFNSFGQVVGISTFKVRDRTSAAFTGNISKEESSGLSGVVAIGQAEDLIARARSIAAGKGMPSAELMPNMPDGVFPVETIKAALSDKSFPLKHYITDVKNYEIKYMTPVYKFYLMEKDRIESLNNRRKRNKEKGTTDTADPFRDLRYWSEYAGELQPVVQILALPETGASGKSLLLSALVQGTVGFSTPLDLKYKADFYQMKLMCDGREVVPLVRNKTEIVRELQNYYKDRKRYTYAGVYSYPYDVFQPGRCRQMQVQIFSEEDIETPITSDVPEITKNRVWADFQTFRVQLAKKAN